MRRRGAAGRGRGGARQNSRGGANKASAADTKKTQKDEDNEINEEEVDSAENNPNSLQFSYGTGNVCKQPDIFYFIMCFLVIFPSDLCMLLLSSSLCEVCRQESGAGILHILQGS